MAIYPIIDGQQAAAEHNKNHASPVTKNSIPAEANTKADDNLVNLDDSQTAATPKPVEAKPAQTPDEIERMLSVTGKPADGPLLDFTDDLKKDLSTAANTTTS